MRRLAILLAAACVAAAMPAASAARVGGESWRPANAKNKKTCRAKCKRWRAASRRPGARAPEGSSPSGDVPRPVAGERPAEPLGRSVSVRAREFSLTLSRPVVAAGNVMVEFNTVEAEDPHDLRLRDSLWSVLTLFEEIAPGLVPPPRQSFPLAVGDYVLFCSLPGHEEQGMRAALSVR